VIPTAWVRAAQVRWQEREKPKTDLDSIGVDVAQGGVDETVLTPRRGNWIDEQIVRSGRETQDGAAIVGLVTPVLRDSAQVNIDCTGGWGGDAYSRFKEMGVPVLRLVMSEGSDQRDETGSLGFYNKRAELWWRAREWFNPENDHEPAIPPDPLLRADLTTPRWSVRRGQAGKGGVVIIESKDGKGGIAERLGRSPDRGESLIFALDDTNPKQQRRERKKGPRHETAEMMSTPWS